MGGRRTLSRERVVIVGGGPAGVSAAAELRRSGFRGEVIVLSEEPDPPYHRPSCSKGLLTGNQLPSDIGLGLGGCKDVHWLLSRRAMSLDTTRRVVETDSGEAYMYDGLIIATGSHAVTPPDVPMDQPGIHVLHRLADAWALRRDLRNAESVAIVGAGLTGCEAAWAVRSMARECVIIDSKPQVMTRALGALAGSLITDQLRRERVKLRLERRVRHVQRRRNGQWRLWLDDGTEETADLVVMTTGERPDTAWLKGAVGIDSTDGVLCDSALRVIGAEGIVAAGAVARWPNLRNDTTPRRAGQWITALQQGQAAARTLLAGDEPVPPVTPLNRLWSDQFGLRIQVAGEIAEANTQVHMTQMRSGRRDVARAGLLVSYLKHDRLVGLVAVNASRAFTAVTRSLLLSPLPVSLSRAGSLDLVQLGQDAVRHSRSGRSKSRFDGVDHNGADSRRATQSPRRSPVRHSDERVEHVNHSTGYRRATDDLPAEPLREPAPRSRGHRSERPASYPAPANYLDDRADDTSYSVGSHRRPDPAPPEPPREPAAEPARTQRPERQHQHQAATLDESLVIRRESTVRGAERARIAGRNEQPRMAEQESEIVRRDSNARDATRSRSAERRAPRRTADAEPDVIWRESTMRGARARIAEGEPQSRTADYDEEPERPRRTKRPTVRDHRPEQEPESWTYS